MGVVTPESRDVLPVTMSGVWGDEVTYVGGFRCIGLVFTSTDGCVAPCPVADVSFCRSYVASDEM